MNHELALLADRIDWRYFEKAFASLYSKTACPAKPKKSDTAYDWKKKWYSFRCRAGIEPVFGHLKTDHRMQDNFLSGRESASINAMLAATGWNLKKMMKDLAKKSAKTLFVLLQIFFGGPQLNYRLLEEAVVKD